MTSLAFANLYVQILLLAAVLAAAYLARKKRFQTHCLTMRIAVGVQVAATAGVMLPSLLGYIEHGTTDGPLYVEIVLHHTLGVAVIVLFVYINLVFMGRVRALGRLVTAMRLAFASWVLSVALGFHLFYVIWL